MGQKPAAEFVPGPPTAAREGVKVVAFTSVNRLVPGGRAYGVMQMLNFAISPGRAVKGTSKFPCWFDASRSAHLSIARQRYSGDPPLLWDRDTCGSIAALSVNLAGVFATTYCAQANPHPSYEKDRS
jgi:hypothetical protein